MVENRAQTWFKREKKNFFLACRYCTSEILLRTDEENGSDKLVLRITPQDVSSLLMGFRPKVWWRGVGVQQEGSIWATFKAAFDGEKKRRAVILVKVVFQLDSSEISTDFKNKFLLRNFILLICSFVQFLNFWI